VKTSTLRHLDFELQGDIQAQEHVSPRLGHNAALLVQFARSKTEVRKHEAIEQNQLTRTGQSEESSDGRERKTKKASD
jgi:hypothetical protein